MLSYIKISNSFARSDDCLKKAGQLSILPTSLDIFDIQQYYVQHSFERDVYIKNIYSVATYQTYLMRLGELIIFEPWREKYNFFQPS